MTIWDYKGFSWDWGKAASICSVCLFCRSSLKRLPARYREFEDFEVSVAPAICLNCGWWTVAVTEQDLEPTAHTLDHEDIFDDGSSRWTFDQGAAGILRELDLTDIKQPLNDVRDYLTLRYEKRFELHPRVFEKTVASIFRDRGFNTRVTSYSGDGGIDVILERSGETIGVQVKRYKNAISAEQIRALAGALFIGGYTKGVFVTTSRFQPGGNEVTTLAQARGMAIELLDAPRFLEELKIAQRAKFSEHDFERYYDLAFCRYG